MTEVSQIIRTASLEESQAKYPLPPYLLTAAKYFEKAHVIYRNVKFSLILKNAQENPHDGNPFIYGSAIDVLAPMTETSAYALQIALIGKSVNDIVKQYEEVYLAYQSFQDALYNRFSIYDPDSFNPDEKLTITSPSFKKQFKDKVAACPAYLLHVAETITILFLEIFKLAMCLEDVRLLTNGDISQRNYACTALVAEWQQYKRDLQNRSFLIKEMNNNNIIVDKILNKINKNSTAKSLLNLLQEGFNQLTENQIVIHISTTAAETLGGLANENAPLMIQYKAPKRALGNEYANFPCIPWAGQSFDSAAVSSELPLIVKMVVSSPEKVKMASDQMKREFFQIFNTSLMFFESLSSPTSTSTSKPDKYA